MGREMKESISFDNIAAEMKKSISFGNITAVTPLLYLDEHSVMIGVTGSL
jgi:hypothetical protein